MQTATVLHHLLADLSLGLEHPTLPWQSAILIASLLAAWLLNRLLKNRFPEAEGAWKVGMGGISRVIFPLTALFLILIGKALLRHGSDEVANLLNVAVPLLVSLALIRLAVYVLRHAFSPSGWLYTSERFIASIVWIALALHLTGFLPEIVQVLDEADFHFGKHRVSILMVLGGLLSVAATLLVALWLGRALENRVMRAEKLDMNLRVVIAKLVRIGLILLGVLIALPAAGIDLTVLSVFGGALGVGLGFGLQKIASNYVSGFIILLDRSIHMGDLVTVDGRYGTVSQLTARYTVVRGLNGTEAIIPNETLITSTVINHSFSDRRIQITLPLQVSYQSPLERAMEIAVEAAQAQPRVLADPAPKAFLKDFGDNGINLELVAWVEDAEAGLAALKSDIQLDIWKSFQKEGIEIPYPQREVRMLGQG